MIAFAAARDCEMTDTDGWCFDEVDLGEETKEAAAKDGTRLKMYIDDSNHITRDDQPTTVFGDPAGCWEFRFNGPNGPRPKFRLNNDNSSDGYQHRDGQPGEWTQDDGSVVVNVGWRHCHPKEKRDGKTECFLIHRYQMSEDGNYMVKTNPVLEPPTYANRIDAGNCA